jgi:hypothetical protein
MNSIFSDDGLCEIAVGSTTEEKLTNVYDVIPAGYYTVYITRAGEILGDGQSSSGELTQIGNFSNPVKFKLTEEQEQLLLPANQKVKQITCSWYQTMILTHNNRIFACGSNSDMTLSTNGNASCFEQLIELDVPEQAKQSGIKQIDGCHYDFIMLTNDGSVYARGSGNYGTGSEDTPDTFGWKKLTFQHIPDNYHRKPIDIGVGYMVTAVTFGQGFTLGLDRLYNICRKEQLVDIEILTQS